MSVLGTVSLAKAREAFSKTLDQAAFQVYRSTFADGAYGSTHTYAIYGSPIAGKLKPLKAEEKPANPIPGRETSATMQIDVNVEFYLLVPYGTDIKLHDQVVHLASGTTFYVTGVETPRTGTPISLTAIVSEDASGA